MTLLEMDISEVAVLPADGMKAAGRPGDFGMSPWQLRERLL
jgi:hypothetical protein